ncbi:DUF1479-domain-containing protein [Teratosphaeria nubilosa]|uniref:DUF1479-domain-containing protein n=1 Tax=Teratosphaeria nubilosa TaxID=161662 RepID=A0A6G1L325_9PEZI|nr:DUF1479-domain-containing protein [Teratosphaeria nubilosa]
MPLPLSLPTRRTLTHPPRTLHLPRTASTHPAPAPPQKPSGDISDAFASLSGLAFEPLPPRFATLKATLLANKKEALTTSFHRLLRSLRDEIPLITAHKTSTIPSINFRDIVSPSQKFKDEYLKRGVAVIRDVIPSKEVLDWKRELNAYIARNPHTKAFPPENPQVYELYWSPAQVRARSHPNLLAAQKFLMSFWHSRDPAARVSTKHPVMYADRLRMRAPGDQRFALGCHVDGGSCERWEGEGYGRGRVYEEIFRGNWEAYDPWESSCRLPVNSDLYQGIGACSMFRMAQGWLALSETKPFEGTLLVNPLLRHATAYFLLRPFFAPKKPPADPESQFPDDAFLHPTNWSLEPTPTSWLQGATPGRGQELHPILHPHLHLHIPHHHHHHQEATSMTHIPVVAPGDYVAWHCDSIHAVDARHAGDTDSSVLYIPACPLTEGNARFLARQREAFLSGVACPDFGGGVGESRHVGRPGAEMVERTGGADAMRAWGLRGWDGLEDEGLGRGERGVLGAANEILGFAS